MVSVQSVLPSEAVVSRIADAEGVDTDQITPLYDVIDPEALNTLIEDTDSSRAPLEIGFTYQGYDVTVTGDGVVHLDEDETPDSTDV